MHSLAPFLQQLSFGGRAIHLRVRRATPPMYPPRGRVYTRILRPKNRESLGPAPVAVSEATPAAEPSSRETI